MNVSIGAGIKLSPSRLVMCTGANSLRRKHCCQARISRNLTTANYDRDELGPCHFASGFRPVFKRARSLHNNIRGGSLDRAWINKFKLISPSDSWAFECADRIRSAGLRRSSFKWPWDPDKQVITNSNDPLWDDAFVVREACVMGCALSFAPFEEIQARKLCAELQDPRYPRFYHSLSKQAHTLYLLGRVELERETCWHPLAWYMLMISAGLGQLDSALLLHQLEKRMPGYSLQSEQRAVVKGAAETRLDWRAMVAHSEYLLSKAKGRGGSGRLTGSELDKCLELLSDAMTLTSPKLTKQIQRETPPEDCIDAESLEVYDPPYKLLLDMTVVEMQFGDQSEEMAELFELAVKSGAFQYNDPDAAWHYVQWHLENQREHGDEWVHCVKMAAQTGNADACFQLAKYYLRTEGWYPMLSARIMADAGPHREIDSEDPNASKETQKRMHDAIISRKNREMLKAQDGISWMKTAAKLHIDDAGKMLNRYAIVAGLLRQNGFLAEGQEVLLEAQLQLKDCVGDPRRTAKAMETLSEFVDLWNEKLAQDILAPETIEQLLNPTQRR